MDRQIQIIFQIFFNIVTCFKCFNFTTLYQPKGHYIFGMPSAINMFVFLRQVAARRRLWGAINPRVATVRFISFSLATKNISSIVRAAEREREVGERDRTRLSNTFRTAVREASL